MNIYNHEIIINTHQFVFGDGQHETTRFLLFYLAKYCSEKAVVDCGCGTGILSIFASKNGAKSVTAIDCDYYACECIKDNAGLNNVDNIDVICDDISRVNDVYGDIVTANFPQGIAHFLLPIVARFVKKDGFLLTTWHKPLPREELTKDFDIIEWIEGIEYDCFVLRKR